MVDFTVEGSYDIAGADGLEFVEYAVSLGYLGIVVVFGDIRQEVEADTRVDRGYDVEDGVAVVVRRPVPGGFRTEEFETGEDGKVFSQGVFDASGNSKGQFEVATEVAYGIVSAVTLGVHLIAKEHGHTQADGGAPVDFCLFTVLVTVDEVGPVE